MDNTELTTCARSAARARAKSLFGYFCNVQGNMAAFKSWTILGAPRARESPCLPENACENFKVIGNGLFQANVGTS